MQHRTFGTTGLRVAPIVLGGNVFGWTADEKASFEVLDAFFGQGFNAIDTADTYSAWAPGNRGGESETIIGRWLASRPQRRAEAVVFTKAGGDMGGPGRKGLSARWLTQSVEDSLKRLGVDAIDVHFAHFPDPDTPEEDTLRAYERMLQAGKIKAIGVSNVDAAQLSRSLQVARDNGLTGYQVLQPEYNLYNRDAYEGALRDLCLAEDIAVVPYYALAAGFLTGKYRSEADLGKSVRGGGIAKYLNPRGEAILAALDQVSAAHGMGLAEVALAWLIAQPGVNPIASATSARQVETFGRAAALRLTPEDMRVLTDAG